MYTYVCVHIYVTYIHTYIHTYIQIYTYMYIHTLHGSTDRDLSGEAA